MGSRRFFALILIFAASVSCLTIRGASASMVAVTESNAEISTFIEACGGNESSISDNADAIFLPVTDGPVDHRLDVHSAFGDPIAIFVINGRRYRGPPQPIS
jgi:hypothetical protein